MSNFYAAFEAKFRGSRALIKQRLAVYQPFLQAVLAINPAANALDLGCGRGEWLEYLSEVGYSAQGVDLDEGMLADCKKLGLNAQQGDALETLHLQPSESLDIVSGFHLAEHLPFIYLRQLVDEALRVLKPGGLLILETPNPENLVVGTNSFYLDPTHQKPLPPDLLAFLAEHSGFVRTKILRLQEPSGLLDSTSQLGLQDVLTSVSPDYALVAQKTAPAEVLQASVPLFAQDYGVNLNQLAGKFDEHLETQLSLLQAQLSEIHTSSIWKITAPIRWLDKQLLRIKKKGFKAGFKLIKIEARALITNQSKKQLTGLIALINRLPKLKFFILKLVSILGLEVFIRSIYAFTQEKKQQANQSISLLMAQTEQQLTPTARKYYQQLNLAVQN